MYYSAGDNLFVGSTVYYCTVVLCSLVGSTVLSTVNLLENFGAQRANHVETAAFSSPRSLALSARQLSARQLSF